MSDTAKKVYISVAPLVQKYPGALLYSIFSDRSDGKTTLIITSIYDSFVECGKRGVILRRVAAEASAEYCETLLFLLKKIRPECGELKFSGSAKRTVVSLFCNGEKFAVVGCISRGGALKSALDEGMYKDVYFDEYVPLNGRYFPREVDIFIEIWRTIDRDTFTTKMWVFSNRITTTCPLFRYFGIKPRKGISAWKDGSFALLMISNRGNVERVKASPLGALTAGTPYHNYIDGGTLFDRQHLIKKEHGRARMPFTISTGGGIFGVYYAKNGLIIDTAQRSHPAEALYITEPTGGKNGGIYLPQNKELYTALKNRYHFSEIFYASEEVFEQCEQLDKMLSRN